MKTLLSKNKEKAYENSQTLVRDVPTNLGYLIKMGNEFPSDAKTLDEICNGDYENQWRNATNWIFEYLSNSPNCLEYVKGESPISEFSDTILPDVPRLYESLRKSILKLKILADTSIYPPYILEKLNGSVFCNIDNNGIMTFSGEDEFTRIMQNVQAVRVRKCEICGKVFWAKKVGGKSDSKACSKEHAARLRNRKSYENNKENRIKNLDEINKKRRENYNYKKKLKKGKDKNGNL